jgi:hypothetical protein
MPDPTITIGNPAPGAIVPATFPVSGTYTPAGGFPPITVILKDANGNVVATAMNLVIATGMWSGQITVARGYVGATVEASLPGADTAVGNITVLAP